MSSRTKAIKLSLSDAERLRAAARRENVSLSLYVNTAIGRAVEHGLAGRGSALAAGGAMIGPRLDAELIDEAEAEADELGVSFGAYARAALGSYLDG